MKRGRGFTILELLVVVAILAILAVAIVPNFIGAIDKSKASRELAEINSVQKAVDMYYMDNSKYPVMQADQPIYGNMDNVDFSKLYPDYLNKLPHFSYWMVSYEGKVYHEGYVPCTIQGNVLTLNNNYTYRVYKLDGTEASNYSGQTVDLTQYKCIVPIDPNGNELPVINEKFTNILEHPQASNKEQGGSGPAPVETPNTAPVPQITMSPETGADTGTNIVWGYTYTDAEGDKIIDTQWDKQDSYSTAGNYTARLRVEDEHGLWSDWVTREFTVGSNPNVGREVRAPEAGWQRIDETASQLVYSPGWYRSQSCYVYWGSYIHYTNTPDAPLSFKFYGTKLRIIGLFSTATNYSQDMQVSIDGGTPTIVNTRRTFRYYQAIMYEMTNLPLGEHTVSIVDKDGLSINLDAFDIDSTGHMIAP